MAYEFNPFTHKLDITSETSEGSSLPATAANGAVFFNTTDSGLYVYYNGWISIGASFATARYGSAIYESSAYAPGPAPAVYA